LIQQYDVNVLGAQRVNRAALPHLRGQGKGLLVWVGSSSTRGGTPPFLGPYFAARKTERDRRSGKLTLHPRPI
jgi:NAD(P)-dependent dehydrogenase (short-subunit alcohol dehydrogenase family)